MTDHVYLNEVRLSLKPLLDATVFQYRVNGLSTGHKKHLERQVGSQLGRVCVVEGDVLFFLPSLVNTLEADKREVAKFLSEQMRMGEERPIAKVVLAQAPEILTERLVFAAICLGARARNIYPIYGRTFFRPKFIENKLAQEAADSGLEIAGTIAKLHLVPTYLGLINICDSYRSERVDVELVGMCKYRAECTLANSQGGCPYVTPGMLGYYEREVLVAQLSKSERLSFERAYEECPKRQSASKWIMVRASKKAKGARVHPAFIAYAKFSSEDLAARPEVAKRYREATLMASNTRWNFTQRWITDIFGLPGDQPLPARTELKIPGLTLPIEIAMASAIPIPGTAGTPDAYRALLAPEQQVVVDQLSLTPKSQSGGWLFNTDGAYDREDVNRSFARITPCVVVPKSCTQQAAGLLHVLTTQGYQARTRRDSDFAAINSDVGRQRYGVELINPWRAEEGIFEVDGADNDYWKVIQDIKREWHLSATPEPGRLALVVVPPSETEGDESELYYKLKKVLVEEGIPSQFLTTETLAGLSSPGTPFGSVLQSLWLNIYAKVGGKPWRLANQLGNVHCFIGIGFALNPRASRNHIFAGFAHVFDRYGAWVNVASDAAGISEEDRQDFEGPLRYTQGTSSFKISQTVTKGIVYNALRLYQDKQSASGQPPKNIVLHKLGPVYECEILGFLEGVRQSLGTLAGCRLGVLQVQQDHHVRLYGDAEPTDPKLDRAVLRRTAVVLDPSTVCLATTGRVRRGVKQYYPGIGTPVPLLLNSHAPAAPISRQYGCDPAQFYPIQDLTNHAMALTQLHWGSTRDVVRLPITALYAQKVADLVSKTGAKVDTYMSYNLPWFL